VLHNELVLEWITVLLGVQATSNRAEGRYSNAILPLGKGGRKEGRKGKEGREGGREGGRV